MEKEKEIVGNEKANAEIEALKAEIEKQKQEAEEYKQKVADLNKVKDTLASENADYKRKHQTTLTDQERLELERKERENDYKKLKLELTRTKVENVFARAGFEETEFAEIAKGLVNAGGESDFEDLTTLVKNITELVKAREAKAVELAKVALTKEQITLPQNNGGDPEETFLYDQYRKQKETGF